MVSSVSFDKRLLSANEGLQNLVMELIEEAKPVA
ncbi:hypothetical protein PC129_g205 [Phytophthora cactorum]|uniref:Uncharacterized protein n=1 Tax=Phytophthora cactorum TaxID=29920 RepID=A0A329RU81_9STRA|nr:hypothetical protein Pcac1_g8599 [Phytophthora cactorum]KAG2813203.1 hypothetical protein PC112_g14837 [Phytophthora cactorum]KAG2849265.1 hypothetical protein PC111_g8 [Phytophthora cactorum]KAG2869434.1 hypothetical protein PC113_g245 [Phytophthora cactorum]KAG2906861.1 hypothetical protein PC115_g14137 [Phytophthora cactorum]